MNAGKTLVCALLVAVLANGAAFAQQGYPAKPVRFIVTYPPGGSSEVMARIIGQQLTEYWGQPVIVEPRPGADGSIWRSKAVVLTDFCSSAVSRVRLSVNVSAMRNCISRHGTPSSPRRRGG